MEDLNSMEIIKLYMWDEDLSNLFELISLEIFKLS